MVRRFQTDCLAALLLAVTTTACTAGKAERTPIDKPPLGLFTTLPIYWSEAPDISAMLNSETSPHWARVALEEDYVLVPMDVLDAARLKGLDQVILAQPRALAPAENVALDNWVRAGGRALVFADPMLVQHSIFPIGDKRRPQDVVLLSPILARWGLSLRFDEGQGEGPRTVVDGDLALPVVRAGHFARSGGGEDSACALAAEAILAKCSIGKGEVLVVADADLLDIHAENGAADAFETLVTRAFPNP